MRPALSLRAALVLLLGVVLLPALVAAVVSDLVAHREVAARARAELLLVARLASASQKAMVEGVHRMLLAATQSRSVREMEEPRCTVLFDRLMASSDSFALVGMARADGRTVCQSRDTINVADRAYFQRAMRSGRFAIGNHILGRRRNAPLVSFALPVRGEGDAVVGVAYASIDLRRIDEGLRALPLPPQLLVQLVDSDGTVLATSRPERSTSGAPVEPAVLREAVRARSVGEIDSVDERDRRWMHALVPVDGELAESLYVTVSVREDLALAEPLASVHRQLLGLGAAALLAVVLAWVLGRRLVERPIAGLLSRMQAIGRPAGPAGPAPLPQVIPIAEFRGLDAALGELAERLDAHGQERDALLAETRHQAEQLGRAQRLARVAYCELHLADGRVLASPGLSEVLGMPVARTLDGVMRHVGAADRERLRAALGRCVSTGLPLDVEFALRRPDGSELWLHVLGEIDDRGSQGRRLVAAVQDVGERRAAEAAAREHQARLEAAVTAARLGTYDHDLRSGRALWLGRHEAIWGYAEGDYDGSVAMFLQRVHPDDRARVAAVNDESRRLGRPLHLEYRVQWPDGRVRWVADSGNVVRDDDGVPVRFVGVVLDVTEVKEAEQHLAAMSRRISGVLESTSDGFVSVDRCWRVTYANRRGAEVLGHTPPTMLGRTLRELFPESVDSDFDVTVRRAMRERQEMHIESYYPPWGRWYENHVFPSDEGLAVYFRDITPRKQAEAAIAALVERLQALREMDRALLHAGSVADVAQLGLARLRGLLACERASYLTTTPDGGAVRCLWSDGASASAFPPGTELPASELGRGFIETLAREGRLAIDDVDRVERPSPLLQRAAAAGVRSLLVLPLRDGERVVGAALMAAPRAGHFDAGRVAIAEGIVDRLNIAVEQLALRQRLDRHAAELERRVAERTAEVVEANRELEAFSYSVSHDLRAPLQTVSGFSQALLSRHADQLEPKARHYLERILAGAQQMEQLIADLLALAQVSHAAMQARPVDLVPVAREVLQALRDQAPARDVDVVLPPSLVVHGDRALLRVLLDNLLGNAWKFTAPVARPRIELGTEPLADGGELVFHVTDNGVGFDPAQAADLFTPFRRLHSHSEFPGTGIGLATVQRIVTRHGGRVWAESRPGEGTVLRVALPRRGLDDAATEST